MDNPFYDIATLVYHVTWLPENVLQYLLDEKPNYKHKGYGTPEQEMKFMHKIFMDIRNRSKGFDSFSWSQCNAYNGDYYHFELSFFVVNDTHIVNSDFSFSFEYHEGEVVNTSIWFDHIDVQDQDEMTFAQLNNITLDTYGLEPEYWDSFFEFKKEKYGHLEMPCLQMLTFLKFLEMQYSMYYLLYVFGNGVKVRFNEEGVNITKHSEHELDGYPLGKGMDYGNDLRKMTKINIERTSEH
jgi:hypothetical protein